MKKTLLTLLLQTIVMTIAAQTAEPCGVYEGVDKIDGLARQAYLEINITDAQVPDFSQTFTKGELYNFKTLQSNFMKKPSRFFAGKKATGFIKFRSTIALISNSEVLMLSDPQPVQDGYSLTWTSDMNGQKGKCVLHIGDDGQIWFTGLGTFSKDIGSDNLKLALSDEPTAKKPYFNGGSKAPTASTTKAGVSATSSPTPYPPFKVDTDANGNIKVPASNTGTLTGRWISPEGMIIKLNSTRKAYQYYGTAYYGLITMNGPGYVNEGIVCVKKQSDTCYGLYSVALDTDARIYHYSEIRFSPDGKSITYQLCGSLDVLSQMGKLITNTAVYSLSAFKTQYYGMFSTGKEVVPMPVNFYFKQSYDNGYGDSEEGYGLITRSYNTGRYIDNDFIYDAKILANGNVSIKFRCGRTDNKYSAVLVWNDVNKTWTTTQIKCISGEGDDCYMINNPEMKFTGEIK